MKFHCYTAIGKFRIYFGKKLTNFDENWNFQLSKNYLTFLLNIFPKSMNIEDEKSFTKYIINYLGFFVFSDCF